MHKEIITPEEQTVSALEMLQELIAEDRRVRWNADGTREIVTREQAGDDWDKPEICKQWLPGLGARNKCGMVDEISVASKLIPSHISKVLSGEKKYQTLYNYARILNAVKSTPEERAPILDKFCRERIDAEIEGRPYKSPADLFALPDFRELDYDAAFNALIGCFLLDKKEEKPISIADYLAQSPPLLHEGEPRFEILTQQELNRLSGHKTNKIKRGLTSTRLGFCSDPFAQLAIFYTLGLSAEQAAQMISLYWTPENWAKGASDEAPTLKTLAEIFTSPPENNPSYFKTRGQLLRELRLSHCLATENGETKIMPRHEAVDRLQSALLEKGLAAFDAHAPSLVIQHLGLEDIAKNLLKTNVDGTKSAVSRQLVNYMEEGKQGQSNCSVGDEYVPQIVRIYDLPPEYAQAFRDAPKQPVDSIEISGEPTSSADYRERLSLGRARYDKPEISWGMRIIPQERFAAWLGRGNEEGDVHPPHTADRQSQYR